MTEEEAKALWEKHRDGVESCVKVYWPGAEADRNPDFAVEFDAKQATGKFLHDLLTEVQGTELNFGISTSSPPVIYVR